MKTQPARAGFFMARSSAKLGYGYRWQQARAIYLRQNPFCRMCASENRMVAATVVDHIVPHKGDPILFWDQYNNWQPLCATHHSASKQAEEKRGRVVGCDANGIPLAGWK